MIDWGEFCLTAYKSLELASSVYNLKSCSVYVAYRDFFLNFHYNADVVPVRGTVCSIVSIGSW